jgi:hypothetical protein
MGAAARLRADTSPIADPADHHQQCDDYQSASGRVVQRRITECCGDACQQRSAEGTATRRAAADTNPGGSAARRYDARQADHARAFVAADRSDSDRRTRRTAPWIRLARQHASDFGPEYSDDDPRRTAPGIDPASDAGPEHGNHRPRGTAPRIDPVRPHASDPRPERGHRPAWRGAQFGPATATRSGRSTSAGALDCDYVARSTPPWSGRLAAAHSSSASQPAGHAAAHSAGGKSAAAACSDANRTASPGRTRRPTATSSGGPYRTPAGSTAGAASSGGARRAPPAGDRAASSCADGEEMRCPERQAGLQLVDEV